MPRVFCPVNTNWHQSCCSLVRVNDSSDGRNFEDLRNPSFAAPQCDGHHSDTKQSIASMIQVFA